MPRMPFTNREDNSGEVGVAVVMSQNPDVLCVHYAKESIPEIIQFSIQSVTPVGAYGHAPLRDAV